MSSWQAEFVVISCCCCVAVVVLLMSLLLLLAVVVVGSADLRRCVVRCWSVYSSHTVARGTRCAAFYFTWLGLLLSTLPSWLHMVAYVSTGHAVLGFLHVQICLSHFSMPCYHGHALSGQDGDSWFVMQVCHRLWSRRGCAWVCRCTTVCGSTAAVLVPAISPVPSLPFPQQPRCCDAFVCRRGLAMRAGDDVA